MILRMVRTLVEAGATPASAARAAVILDRGGSLAEARAALVVVVPSLAGDLLAAVRCSCDPRFVDVAHDLDCPVHGLAAELDDPR